jgi:hypothetical protein
VDARFERFSFLWACDQVCLMTRIFTGSRPPFELQAEFWQDNAWRVGSVTVTVFI